MDDLLPTHLLETFVEVCRHGSVSGAAETLHRTQPAVSHRIKQLEELTGIELFERSGRGIQVTRRGELLLDEAESILRRLRALHDVLHEADDVPKGKVTIGTLPTLARHYLDTAFGDAISKWPQVKWCVHTAFVGELFDQLHAGTIDVVYLIGDIDVHGLDVIDVEPVEMCLAVPTSMWSGDAPPPRELLQRERLLMWKGHNDPTFTMIENRARALGFMQPNTPEIPDIDTLKALARRGIGYTILPDYVFRADVEAGTLGAWPLEGFKVHLPLRRYVVSGRHHGAAVARFLELVEGE